jgi:CrcB protein
MQNRDASSGASAAPAQARPSSPLAQAADAGGNSTTVEGGDERQQETLAVAAIPPHVRRLISDELVPAPGQDIGVSPTPEDAAAEAAAQPEGTAAALTVAVAAAAVAAAPTQLRLLLIAAVGGAAGSALRATVALELEPASSQHWPWRTFTVNVSGSAALGAITKAAAMYGWPKELLTLLGAGFLAGYTTFSTLCAEVIALFHAGRGGEAVGYLFASQAVALVAAAAGWVLVAHSRRPLAALRLANPLPGPVFATSAGATDSAARVDMREPVR